ncbi:MAG TPA: YhjD/YihY/BrkB family envelope integrity protein [Actinomycetota bacterium]|nr:YhjD/YihY/BrkB family envelope integrity protein [Actinomycetota bacterium]
MLERLKESRVVQVGQAVSSRYGDDAGGYLASSIAFYGFVSLFPMLLLALSIVGFVLAANPELQDRVVGRVTAAVPGLEELIGENIRALIANRAGAGIVGLGGLFWTGTAAVGASRNALRQIFREPRIEGFVRQKGWLLLTTAWLGAVALVSLGAAAAIAGVRATGPLGVALLVVIPVVTLALDLGMFLAAYWVLLRRRYRPASLLPGAAFAAIGWAVLKLAGAWYATRTAESSSAVYGGFAAAVAALLLLYLAARLFVYGAELNAVLMEEGGGRVETPDGTRPVREGTASPQERSTGELVRAIGTDMVELVRKEIELAKQEVREGIAARIKGAVGLAVAGVVGLFALGFLAAAAAWALDIVLQPWASRLIVGGVFLLVAAVAAGAGVRQLRSAPLTPRRTQETIKEDVEWARAQLKR